MHDGLWRSSDGSIWAFADDTFSLDRKVRPGVGFFSWRKWWPWYNELTDAVRTHDYVYSSPAYQAFNTRQEADALLESHVNAMADTINSTGLRILAKPFRKLAEWFGGKYWENETTR
jgi:hypothetical protein